MPNIILASGSVARHAMLENAGVIFRTHPADLDEAAIARNHAGKDIPFITQKLADAKALHVSAAHPHDLVIGSDQTLEFEEELISKAKDKAEGKKKLKQLRGNTHKLHAAVSVALGKTILFSYTDSAILTMQNFSDAFLEDYIEKDPDALTSCVGGYKIEGAGARCLRRHRAVAGRGLGSLRFAWGLRGINGAMRPDRRSGPSRGRRRQRANQTRHRG